VPELSLPLLIAALAIIAGLAGYALWLWRQVWQRQRQQQALNHQRRERLGEDLHILAGSLLDGQLPMIEGAIRIKVLIDNYDTQLSQDTHSAVFHTLYEATIDVPTHAAWQALSATERSHYRSRFAALEREHGEALRAAAKWLRDQPLG
jgi:hypothetical protein